EVARAQVVIHPKGAQRVLQHVAALHADQRRNAALLELALDIGGGEGQRESLGISGDDLAGNVDLLQLDSGEAAVLDLSGHIDRPELGTNLPLRQPGEVGVTAGGLAKIVGSDIAGWLDLGANAPRKVVVPVNQRRRPK